MRGLLFYLKPFTQNNKFHLSTFIFALHLRLYIKEEVQGLFEAFGRKLKLVNYNIGVDCFYLVEFILK